MTAARGPDFGPSAWLPVPGRLPDGLEAISARLADFAVAPRLVDRLRSLREGAAERQPPSTARRSFLALRIERGKLAAVRFGQMFFLAHVMRGRRRPGRRAHAQHLGHLFRDAPAELDPSHSCLAFAHAHIWPRRSIGDACGRVYDAADDRRIAPRRESLGELVRATIIAILIVLSTVPITFAYAMIGDPEEAVGGLLWDQFRLDDLADEATRDFPEFFGPAAEQGLAAEADEGGYVYLYLLDEARPMAGQVCDAFYQAMLGKDPTLMSGFIVFTDGTPEEEVHCGGAWWTWWWNDAE